MVSPGVGYVFDAGDIGVGPTARYIHVFETGERLGGEDGQIATLGIELVLFDCGMFRASDRRDFEQERPMLPASTSQNAGSTGADLLGRPAHRALLMPERAGNRQRHQRSRWFPGRKIQLMDDRLVVDERVFFDYDKAELKPEGPARASSDSLSLMTLWVRVEGTSCPRARRPAA